MTTPSDASQAVELPPLPEPYFGEPKNEHDTHLGPCFIARDMEAYAREAIAQDRAARAQAEPVAATMQETCVGADIRIHGVHMPTFNIGTDANPARRAFVDAVNAAARAQGAGEAVAQWQYRPNNSYDLPWVNCTEREARDLIEVHGRVYIIRALYAAPTIPQAAEVPGHRALSREEAAKVDEAAGIVELPPIRIDCQLFGMLERRAKANGVILQAEVRRIITGAFIGSDAAPTPTASAAKAGRIATSGTTTSEGASPAQSADPYGY